MKVQFLKATHVLQLGRTFEKDDIENLPKKLVTYLMDRGFVTDKLPEPIIEEIIIPMVEDVPEEEKIIEEEEPKKAKPVKKAKANYDLKPHNKD